MTIPAHAPVVVIGGGVMGCSILYHLAELGVSDAILLERNQIASGTTWHSAAQVRALRSTQNATRLIQRSIELYSTLEAETGQSTGWIKEGSISIATHQDRLSHIRRQEDLAHLFGVPAAPICAAEIREKWPFVNLDDVIGAVWVPGDGRVSPADLCLALTKGARSRGARIFEHCPVTGIVTQNNQVKEVITPQGTVRCEAVAICSGLWSRQTGERAGCAVPLWPCEHFYLLTRPIEGISGNLPTLSDHDGHLYLRDDSGGLLVGCFEPEGKSISPDALGENFAFQLLDEDWSHFEPMMRNAIHRLPILESAQVKMLLNGPESFTPDGGFMLGETAETKGVFLACGMNSVGVASAGGAGMALAHCIQKGFMPFDLHELDPKRFHPIFNRVDRLASRVPEVLGKHYEITYPNRQWSSARNLRKPPLFGRQHDLQAHFGQVYGWERALYFGKKHEPELTFSRPQWHAQVGREVNAAHTGAAVFDQSTLGKIDVRGPDAADFLNRICTSQMNLPVGRVIYTAMLNERGGYESDLTAIRLSEQHYRLYVGTASIARDFSWLKRNRRKTENADLLDVTEEFAVIALTGPRSGAIARAIGAGALNQLRHFQSSSLTVCGADIWAARLSYVGESGWEITCRADEAGGLFDQMCSYGAKPAGLYAQSSMRIEKRHLAYGHELDSSITPIEAGLSFVIDWDKDFVGKTALQIQRSAGLRNRIVSILFGDDEAVPLGNEPVFSRGELIGYTTSAAYGFRVGSPVALAKISEPEYCQAGLNVETRIAGVDYPGQTAMRSVFDIRGERMKSRT